MLQAAVIPFGTLLLAICINLEWSGLIINGRLEITIPCPRLETNGPIDCFPEEKSSGNGPHLVRKRENLYLLAICYQQIQS